MINRFYSGLLAMMILFVVNQGVAQSTASVKAQEGGKKHQIFNGKNLKGWYTFLKESGKKQRPKESIYS